MLHRPLNLPPLSSVTKYEGGGNYAISKYYRFPYSIFYQHKLRMILNLMDKNYENILDYGCGPAKIFAPELKKRCLRLVSFDTGSILNKHWRFDAIVCASVLEFTSTPVYTLHMLSDMLKPGGQIFVASPMDTWLTRTYFRFIKDSNKRWSHTYLINLLKSRFHLDRYIEWSGLYFAARASKQ